MKVYNKTSEIIAEHSTLNNKSNSFNMDFTESHFLKDTIEHESSPLPLYINIDDSGLYYFKEKNFNYTEKKKKKFERERNGTSNINFIAEKTRKKYDFHSHSNSKISYYNPILNENIKLIKSVSLIQKTHLPFVINKTRKKYSANLNLKEILEENPPKKSK